MNINNVFDISEARYNSNTNSVYFILYEFKNPIRFFAKSDVISYNDSYIEELHPYNGKFLSRIDFYRKCPHFTLRYNECMYSIKLEKKPDNLENFAKEYLPFIIKYRIAPTSCDTSVAYYEKTRKPVEENYANQLLNKATNMFRERMGISHLF